MGNFRTTGEKQGAEALSRGWEATLDGGCHRI